MKKKLKIIFYSVIVFLFTALIIIGNYFYGESVKRGTEVELHSEAESVSVAVSTDDQSLLEESKKWYEKQTFTEIEQKSSDQLLLKADYLKNEQKTEKAVILAHGFRKQRADMGDYVKFYYDRGFDILMPDARGHGESEGDYYGYGWHDRLDIIQWVNRLIDDYGKTEIILHGNSMGAATVLMTSGEDLPQEVKGIVADSSYTSMKEELAHQLKHIYGLPAFPLLDITSVITKIRAGYMFGEVSAVKQVQKNERPLLIIHGDADDLVPTEMGKTLYEAASGEKELWIVPGAGHIKAYEVATSEFETRLANFLEKVLIE